MTKSYLTSLVCSQCGDIFDPDVLQTFCQECKATLTSNYDLEAARVQVDRDELASQDHGMWTWKPFLPVKDFEKIVYLGEGATPMLKADRLANELKLKNLYVKDESINPTGTFKARGLSGAISKANELDVKKVIIPTAGNAGGAMAAYAAKAGMQSLAVMPSDTPHANVAEVEAYGGVVQLIEGIISDAGQMVNNLVVTEGWFNVATFKEPYRLEGKKVMGYELAKFFDWTLPDVIVYPTGGGTGLVGMWKAFHELITLGWLEEISLPRMVSIQPDGCAPVVKAFDEGKDYMEDWKNASTIASGLRVPNSFADRLIMKALYESEGIAVAVSDAEITEAQKHLGRTEGIFAAPEGAATLAGLSKLVDSGWVKSDERIVLFNTGSGLKYIEAA